jgi:alkaline phosphatase D
MRFLAAAVFLFMSLNAFSQSNHQRLQNLKDLKRISFGSCNNQGDAQPLWDDLIRQKPDLWIWGGDNIYADWNSGGNIARGYIAQNEIPKYKVFKRQTPMIGTWDDHDYGLDNANGNFAGKKESQQQHLDFLEVPNNSPLRRQEGIYTSHEYGEESRKIKIILLDNRYFKNLDPEYPLLGRTQWEWLERELISSTAKIHLIVTGLPVTSPLIPYTEEWAESKELNRMLTLLKATKPKGVVFLTGDKHFSSIYKRWGQLEFMSSGMTHIAARKTWFYLSRQYPTTFFGLSYGQIDVSWEEEIPTIKLSMRTTKGNDVHLSKYKWLSEQWQWIK